MCLRNINGVIVFLYIYIYWAQIFSWVILTSSEWFISGSYFTLNSKEGNRYNPNYAAMTKLISNMNINYIKLIFKTFFALTFFIPPPQICYNSTKKYIHIIVMQNAVIFFYFFKYLYIRTFLKSNYHYSTSKVLPLYPINRFHVLCQFWLNGYRIIIHFIWST